MRSRPLTAPEPRGEGSALAAADAIGPDRSVLSAAPACLLTNGSYVLFITAAGTGYSALDGVALTRWRGDRIEDRDGFHLYLRDLGRGAVWSLGHEPVRHPPEKYEATWRPGRFEIGRVDHEVEARLEVCVAPEADLELRRVTLRNRSLAIRRIEVTSWVEVVLEDGAAHAAHPAFSKLFIQTEYVPEARALLARRRPRSTGAHHPWLVHALPGEGNLEIETDRARFLGRGRSVAAPLALSSAGPLSGTTGNVLDPSLSLRRTVVLEPGTSVTMTFLLGAGESRSEALHAIERFREPANVEDAFEGAEIVAREFSDIDAADLDTIAAAARLVATGAPPAVSLMPAGRLAATVGAAPTKPTIELEEPLRFFNGWGGFTRDGAEYVIRLERGAGSELRLPPRPWINVIANPGFGCLVSETGAGCVWSQNSREHRLTPWSNDALLDPHGDALYVRDEESGAIWSPLPGPAAGDGDHEVRHGFGYSSWRHRGQGIVQETCVFVPRLDPLRVARVRMTNASGRSRRLSLIAYQRLVLGARPEESGQFVVTEFDSDSNALLARNPMAGEFAGRVAFAAVVAPPGSGPMSFTCDREAFIGRGGTTERPAALHGVAPLDGRSGASLDPCFVEQVAIDLPAGKTVECTFLLGEAESRSEAAALVRRYRTDGAIAQALADASGFWSDLLSGLRVETPAPALDLMMNGWLAYQTLSCRLWGRTAFYQSSGAFGFRDQLQDSGALVALDPEIARGQILLHAAHQFVEGDVLHWWHPPLGRGIRTRFADDLLWLPYTAASYIASTGDWSLLDERVPFLEGRALKDGEDEAFMQPEVSAESADLYDHCCRAIDRSLGTGAHGLPLFGTGDWNDGMNRVGREGRGESVWMGFFLHTVLGVFEAACERRGDSERIERYRTHRKRLRDALNEAGWDGEWYRRGYYDDGEPLGSRESDECRIDALAQAWSVISGVAPAERARQAIAAVEQHLVSEQDGLIRLLEPPFEHTSHDPGYIRGYVPGVRENGGQYTHAALWVIQAMAELGMNDHAARWLEALSPVHHGGTPERAAIYGAEPYVVAGDVYGVPPHVGRGGWTWYTGSSGWMLRVALESVLGLRCVGGDTLLIKPCIPDHWPEYRVSWRLPGTRREGGLTDLEAEAMGEATRYEVSVRNPNRAARRVSAAFADGAPVAVVDGAARVSIERDGRVHQVEIVLG